MIECNGYIKLLKKRFPDGPRVEHERQGFICEVFWNAHRQREVMHVMIDRR